MTAPVLTTISPTTAQVGSAPFTLSANGSGYAAGAVISFDGVDKATTIVSPALATATIDPAGATPGGKIVTIHNATGPSVGKTFTYTAAPAVPPNGDGSEGPWDNPYLKVWPFGHPLGPDAINNGDFEVDTGYWTPVGTTTFTVVNGQGVAHVPAGTVAATDVFLATNAPAPTAGTYRLAFRASAVLPSTIVVAYSTAPVYPSVQVTEDMRSFSFDFVLPAADPAAQLQLLLGGHPSAWVFTLDNVTLHRVG
jgi:hypothetical protein